MRLALLLTAAFSLNAANLVPTPSTVNWTYTSGSHNYPSQSVALVSSSGATAYSATANSENGWLLVNAAYVSSSATLSAGAYLIPASQIDRLDSGSYRGTVNLTDSNGNTAVITVNLTITGGIVTHPGITLNPASLNFTSNLNGPAQAQNITVTGPTAGLLVVQAASGSLPSWLQAVVTGAAGGYIVVITVAPANLGPGAYRETLLLSIGSATATLPVLLTIQQQSLLMATPTSLTFDYTPGGAPPQAALVRVTSSTGASLPFAASASVQGGNWLAVIGGGATPGTVQVIPQVDGLAPGSYSGSVFIAPQQGAPLVIPVSLTLRVTPVIAVSPSSLSFSYRSGDAVPVPLTVQVAGGGASASFTVQVSGDDWLTAEPTRLAAPTSLTIAVKPAALAPGSYQGTVTLTGTGTAKGSATITVALQVLGSGAATVTINKVTNAAGYQEGGIAPGEMVTIFGTGMAPEGIATLVLDAAGKVATTLNGVQVQFNGTPAPMIYASPGQLAAAAPYELEGRSQVTVQVNWSGQVSNSMSLPVVATAPGVFTADASGTGPAATTTASGVITLYLTGEGQTVPPGTTGKVTTISGTPSLTPAPAASLSIMVGDRPADFTFAGEAPGIVAGVLQLNVAIPKALPPGTYPITVTLGGRPTQSGVTIAVQ